MPVRPDNPGDKWHIVALDRRPVMPLPNWTYELIGPHFQSNPYGAEVDWFVPHGCHIPVAPDRTFSGVRGFLESRPNIEGLVFWRDLADPDCDKVKIKRRDFGLPWPTPEAKVTR